MATVKQNSQPVYSPENLPHKYIGTSLSEVDASTIPVFSTYTLTDGNGTIIDIYISDGTRWNI